MYIFFFLKPQKKFDKILADGECMEDKSRVRARQTGIK